MTMKYIFTFAFPLLLLSLVSCSEQLDTRAETITAIEEARLKALVEADMEVAKALHAEDFQLVNPSGRVYTKETYLGGIESGDLDYTIFRPESEIKVRVFGKSAVVRYRSTIEITVGATYYPPENFWHTDTYEFRNGRWQVVWSQATTIVE